MSGRDTNRNQDPRGDISLAECFGLLAAVTMITGCSLMAPGFLCGAPPLALGTTLWSLRVARGSIGGRKAIGILGLCVSLGIMTLWLVAVGAMRVKR